MHGTQKPVECMRRPIENNSSPGQAVYEPFCGSGTTLIAAEMTGRACHAIELSPAYVDVAVQRWQAFTGERAVLEGSAMELRRGCRRSARGSALMGAGLEPTDEQRRLVRAMAGFGVPQDDIANHLDIDAEDPAQALPVGHSTGAPSRRTPRWRRSLFQMATTGPERGGGDLLDEGAGGLEREAAPGVLPGGRGCTEDLHHRHRVPARAGP